VQTAESGTSASPAALYREAIPAPKWLAGLILLGMAFVGFMIGLEATRDSLEGSERLLFFVFMALALVTQGVVALNFFVLKVAVTSDSVEFAYGIFKRRFRWSQVTGYSVQRYDWKRYGGWGLRFGLRGRRAWSVPGVPEGVSFQVEENGKRREYFVSSRKPAEFARTVAQTSGRPPA
jgi:hypothetical protein